MTLTETIRTIERQFGVRSIALMSAEPERVPVNSTGVPALDTALGVGGWPNGRIIELYGPEASGKTTLTLLAIAQVQAAGGQCAFIDAEHSLDPGWAKRLGVDLSTLLLSQPDNGEQALDIAEALARSGACTLIVVDSVAALVPQVELEGTMQDSAVGLQAHLMSKAMRKIVTPAARTNCTVLFTNQLRQKVGVGFGPSETTTGGNALKYYASMRVEVRRIGAYDKGGQKGAKLRAKVVKNKLATPFTQAEFAIVPEGSGVKILTTEGA